MSKAIKDVRAYYDKTALRWAEEGYADQSMLPMLKQLMSLLPAEPVLLDLCCGAGYESMRMAQLGARVIGIDLSEKSLAIARQRNPGLVFHVRNMLDDYSDIGMVDAVACIAGLVHLPVEQLRIAFERMASVLQPGGRALLVVRDGEGRLPAQSDVEIDGERYDRAFFAHSLRELSQESAGLLSFEKEFADAGASIWRNYLFQKK